MYSAPQLNGAAPMSADDFLPVLVRAHRENEREKERVKAEDVARVREMEIEREKERSWQCRTTRTMAGNTFLFEG